MKENGDITRLWRRGLVANLPSLDELSPIDYCGNVVYDRGERRLILGNGYITFDAATETPSYHFYLRDHLGNNRVVIARDGTVEQVTHYYPVALRRLFLVMAMPKQAWHCSSGLTKKFGGLMRESTNPAVQPYNFSIERAGAAVGIANLNVVGLNLRHSTCVRWL